MRSHTPVFSRNPPWSQLGENSMKSYLTTSLGLLYVPYCLSRRCELAVPERLAVIPLFRAVRAQRGCRMRMRDGGPVDQACFVYSTINYAFFWGKKQLREITYLNGKLRCVFYPSHMILPPFRLTSPVNPHNLPKNTTLCSLIPRTTPCRLLQ
jgi:hypothetical protein